MGPATTWDEGNLKGHAANCVKVRCRQQITAVTHIAEITTV